MGSKDVQLFLSHGDKKYQPEIRNFSYYCFSQKRDFSAWIPESAISKHEWICTSSHGWLVLKHINNDHECSLLNLHSLDQKIKLPDIPLALQVRCWTESFVMTAPPTALNCVIILLGYYCGNALIWRPRQQNWINLQYTGYDLTQLSMTVCNQRIYGIVASKHFVAFDIVDDALKVTYLGRRPSNKYKKICNRTDYLVGSGDDIFWVQLSNPPLDDYGRKVNSVDVFKIDSGRWNRVESIDDRVFYLNGAHSFSFLATNSGIKTNCIHYISTSYVYGNLLHTYDMKTGNMKIENICHIPFDYVTIPQFILVNRKDSHPSTSFYTRLFTWNWLFPSMRFGRDDSRLP